MNYSEGQWHKLVCSKHPSCDNGYIWGNVNLENYDSYRCGVCPRDCMWVMIDCRGGMIPVVYEGEE